MRAFGGDSEYLLNTTSTQIIKKRHKITLFLILFQTETLLVILVNNALKKLYFSYIKRFSADEE